MRAPIASRLLIAALAVACSATAVQAQKKAGQVTRQIQPAFVQPGAAAAAAAKTGGGVAKISQTKPVPATDKMPIYWNDTLETGPAGRMRATLEDGSILSLGQQSKLVVLEHNDRSQQSAFVLQAGRVRAQVVKFARPDSKFEIRTSTAVCGVLGTDEYVELTSPISTLVVNLSDPNSRSQVEVRNSDTKVAGTVLLNPGQATTVDQGKPPTGSRPATGSEVNRAQQDTAGSQEPIATPNLQVASGSVTPGDVPSVRIEAGAQITLDARMSSSGGGSFTGFVWQIPRRNVQSNEPNLVLATNDWAPGTYDGTLTVTTTQNKTATARFNIVVTQSVAGRAAPEEALQALARAYESLQVRSFLSYFHPQNYAGYSSLEETVTRSFGNIAENRVYLRKANGTVSGDTATYQMEFEIRFLPKASALPQAGIPTLTPTASAPRMYAAMGGGGQRAAATASISGSTGAVATFVTLSGLTAPLKLYVNTGAGTTYSFQDLPPGKYLIAPSRNGFSFNPPNRTVDLTEAGLTGVDFGATAETQVVRETVTVQMQYVPNASWYITNLSGPIGSAGLVGIPGVGTPDQGVDAPASGSTGQSGGLAVADFSISASPENLAPIARGGPGVPVTVTLTPLNGFSGNITLSWILPTGIAVSPAGPQAVAVTTGPVSRIFTLSADAAAPLAASVAFVAESGSIKRQGTSNLTIYSLTLSPAGATPVNVFAGGFSASLPVNVATAPGLTTPIAVAASATGISSSTATVNGNGTASLSITTSGPDTGPVQATVTATAPGLPAATLAVPVNRVAPFSFGGGGAVSFMAGDHGSASFQVQLAPGFAGPVVVTPPTLANVTFTPASIDLTASGSAVFDVTATGPFTGAGSFTAAAGTFTATGSANFNIAPGIDFNLTGGSLALMAGQTGSVSVNVNQTKGSPIPISVSVGGTTGGISVSGGGTVTGSGTVTFNVNAAGASPGAASFSATATAGGITRTATVSVTITAQPPVMFSISGGSLTLVAGASGRVAVSVTQSSGPTTSISVSASGYDSSKISVSGGGSVSGSGTVNFTVSASGTALPGPTSFTVTATAATAAGTVTQAASVSVTITPAASFSITGGSVTVTAGAPPASVAVQVTQTVGDPVPISVSTSGVDASKISVSGGGTVTGSGSVTLSVSAPATAAAGATSFTVTASYGGIVQSATVSVAILAAPDFTISGASVSLLPGANAPVSISVTQTAGAPVAINVTTSGVDSSKISVSSGGTASSGSVSLTISALATATAGVTSFTVTASYGSISHSATVTVTIGTFTLNGPGALSVVETGTATVSLSLTPPSFASPVTITSSATPGLTVAGPTSLTGAAGGNYTITAAAGAPNGTVTFTGSAGSLTSSVTVNLTVTDAIDSAGATGGTGFSTGSVPVQVTVSRAAGFTGPVTAELSGAPSGITISPSSGTIDAAKTSFAFTANIASGTAAGGTVSFKVYAAGSTRAKNASATLTVVPAFTLSSGGSLTVTAGSSGSTSVSVNLAQGYSGPVSLSASGGGGAVTISPSSLTASGSASISVSVPATATGGAQSLTVSASGAGITQTVTINVTVIVPPPPPTPTPTPSSITIVSGNNQSAQVGNALPSPLVVQVNSSGGTPLSGITVNFSVSPSGSATLSASTAPTGSNGQAQVTPTLGTIAGPVTVTASVSGVTSAAVFNTTATPGPAASLSIVSGNNQSALGGTALANPLVVKVADQYGNPVSGVAVTFAPSTGGGAVSPASATTGANGQAQATMTLATTPSLPVTVSASASGLAAPVVFNISVAAPVPAAIVVVSGNNQSGQVNAALAAPLVVRVNDSGGNPVSGTSVAFVATGGAALSAATVTTGSNGQAQVTATLGTIAGPVTITASVSGVTTPAVFNITGTAGPAASLSIVSGNNQSALGGTALANPLVVKVADQYGNPVSGVAVTFAPSTGGGAVSPASAITGANGQAQATMTLAATPSLPVTVTASASGVAAPVVFNISAAAPVPAAIVVVSGNNQSGQANTALAVPLVVRVNDSGGNPVSGTSVAFVATGGATLSAATVITGSNGQAQVTATLGTIAGPVTVTASVSGVTTPATFNITGTAGPAASLSIVSGNNQSGLASTALANPLVVRVADQFNNSVPSVAVSFTVASGGGSVSAASVTTGTNGQAQVIWTMGAVAGSNSVTASIPSASSVPAVTFTAIGGAAVGAVSVGSGQAPPNTIASVPVMVNMNGLTADTLSFSVKVTPVGAAPGFTAPPSGSNFSFTPAAGFPLPAFIDTLASPDTISLGFINISPVLSGTVTVGQLQIKVPATAQSGQTYTMQVTGASASLRGVTALSMQPGPNGTLTATASGPPSGGGIVSAGPATAGFSNTLLIPITLTMSSGKSIDTLSFSVSVAAGSGNPPALSANLGFNSASGLPAPGALSGTTSFVSVAWLNPPLSPPLGPGSTVLGNVVMAIPAGVVTGQTYTVRVTGANGTLSGATVSIAPGPDVVVTMAATRLQLMSRSARPDLLIAADEFTYSPAFPREGDTVKFRVHVRNRGAADARNAQVVLMMQDKILASGRADVAAGRTAAVELEWKAERVTGRDLRLAIRTSDQPDDNPPLVTLALRNFAVERRGGLASARRERVTLDAANDGCVGLRLLSASRSSCGGSADLEFTPAITARGRISLRLFASEGGVVDLGAQPLTGVAAAPDAGYQPNAELEQGRTYALKTRNRYALFRVVRISSTVNPRLVSDEVQRRERQRGGRVVNDDLLRDTQDSRTLDRALDAARITIYLEMLVQEDGSANFQ